MDIQLTAYILLFTIQAPHAQEARTVRLRPGDDHAVETSAESPDGVQWSFVVDPCVTCDDDRITAGLTVTDEKGKAIIFGMKKGATRASWTLRSPAGVAPAAPPMPRPSRWVDNGRYQQPHVVARRTDGYPVRLALTHGKSATRLRLYVEYFDRPVVDQRLPGRFRPRSAKFFSRSDQPSRRESLFKGLEVESPREAEMSKAEILLQALDLTQPEFAAAANAESDDKAIDAVVDHFRTRTAPAGPPLVDEQPHPAWLAIADAALEDRYGTIGFFDGFAAEWRDAQGQSHRFVLEDGKLNWGRDPGHLTRHFHWLALARAYQETGAAKYVKRFGREVQDWVDREPFYWPANPQIGGLNWMDGTVFVHGYMNTSNIGRRLELTWWPAYEVFRKSESLDQEAHVAFLVGAIRQARLLMNPTSFAAHDDGGSHGALALLQTAAMLPEMREAPRWKAEALRRWDEILQVQFHPDGSHVSLSTGYNWASIMSLENFVAVMRRAGEPIPGRYLMTLERSYRHPMLLARPDRGQIDLNDGGWGKIDDHLRRALRMFPERADFEWFATDGTSGRPPDETSVYFPDAGHFALRTGWTDDARYLFLDAGPVGASHGKEDKLNLYVALGPHQLISSGGRGAYSGGPFTAYTGSTRGYNTVLVDDGVQSRIPARQEIMSDETAAREFISTREFEVARGAYVHGWHSAEGYTKGRHSRTVVLVKGKTPPASSFFVVFDRLTFGDDARHEAKALFHLRRNHAGVLDDGTKIVHGWDAGASVRIIPARPDRVSVEIIRAQTEPHVQGWHVVGTARAPMNTPAYRWSVTKSDAQAWVIVPAGPDQKWCVTSVTSDLVAGELRVNCKAADGSRYVVSPAGVVK